MSETSTSSSPSGRDLRRMCRIANSGALSTIATDHKQVEDGWPATSMVLPALDIDGTPILLISDLADHTRHIRADNRVSLLLSPSPGANVQLIQAVQPPITSTDTARLTVFGRIQPDPDATTRACYLRAHPDACQYVDFGDFGFYRLMVEAIYWVGGFGKQRRLSGTQFVVTNCQSLKSVHDDIVAHMNADHLDALADIISYYAPQERSAGWHMHSIDCDGMVLASESTDSPFIRIDFSKTIRTPAEARNILVEMCKKSRA